MESLESEPSAGANHTAWSRYQATHMPRVASLVRTNQMPLASCDKDLKDETVTETPMIQLSDIEAAERLAHVVYTAEERALMLDTIDAQLRHAVARRQVSLPVDLGPASRFDPRLPGFSLPDPGPLVLPSATMTLPEQDEDIAFAHVTALSAWIKSGALSCLRLTEIYLERIARIGPRLLCFAAVDEAGARARASALDVLLGEGTWLGPLHGIPYGAKDILDTQGIETAWGAEPYRGRVPEHNATVVQRLHDAGAVMLGKTTVGALAYGDIWYGGVTRNPWNPEEGASGSSAGSGSATGAGLVAFAIGTETLGSIVYPSTRCGVTGLRPTFGRVPRTGAMPLCWTLDKIGPMCRSVADTALVLAAINGADPADPFSIEAGFGADLTAPITGLTLGYFPEDFADPAAHDLDHAALETARGLGARLVPLTRPDLPYNALMNMVFAEAAASFEELTLSGRDDLLTWQTAAAWPNAFRRARFLSAVDHIQLDRLRRRVMQVMDETMRGVDAIVGPSLTGPMTTITNFTGHPCLCLPSGFRLSPPRGAASLGRGRLETETTPETKTYEVPHSFSVWGRLFEEGPVLGVALALERAFALAGRRPDLAY
jgi:Asp-tRNA(Asn)/Glu-tRNA(Gln) amidotransferase A subunit family amidase